MHEQLRIKHSMGLVTQSEHDEIMDQDVSYGLGEDRLGEYFCDTCGVPFHRLDLLRRHRRYIEIINKVFFLI